MASTKRTTAKASAPAKVSAPTKVPAPAKASAPAQQKQFTGRLLVRLNPNVNISALERKTQTRSLNLVNSRDFYTGNTESILSKVLQQADGIVFDKLKVALVNADSAAGIKRMLSLRNSPFLSSEPERYLYKQQAGAKRSSPYRNTAASTWGLQATNVTKSKFTGKDVKITVLDTGFDFTHPDFAGRVIHRKSFVGRTAKDREGHGTHCAGIAGGGRKGKAGVRYGVASEARLYVGKILDDAGEGSDGLALAGIEWALEKGCQVISMSFGAPAERGEGYSTIFEEVAQTAMANHCLLIAATGNESDRAEGLIIPVNHPANCPSIMAVAALTESLKIANYSCGRPASRPAPAKTKRGNPPAAAAHSGEVNIAAPGDNILSAWIGGDHETESGTSMATPFVAGIAALLWEQYPDASAREIWDKLISQAQPLGLPASEAGAGLVYAR
jgi:subtilisin family serine protease